jgi:hypothetical protein
MFITGLNDLIYRISLIDRSKTILRAKKRFI